MVSRKASSIGRHLGKGIASLQRFSRARIDSVIGNQSRAFSPDDDHVGAPERAGIVEEPLPWKLSISRKMSALLDRLPKRRGTNSPPAIASHANALRDNPSPDNNSQDIASQDNTSHVNTSAAAEARNSPQPTVRIPAEGEERDQVPRNTDGEGSTSDVDDDWWLRIGSLEAAHSGRFARVQTSRIRRDSDGLAPARAMRRGAIHAEYIPVKDLTEFYDEKAPSRLLRHDSELDMNLPSPQEDAEAANPDQITFPDFYHQTPPDDPKPAHLACPRDGTASDPCLHCWRALKRSDHHLDPKSPRPCHQLQNDAEAASSTRRRASTSQHNTISTAPSISGFSEFRETIAFAHQAVPGEELEPETRLPPIEHFTRRPVRRRHGSEPIRPARPVRSEATSQGLVGSQATLTAIFQSQEVLQDPTTGMWMSNGVAGWQRSEWLHSG